MSDHGPDDCVFCLILAGELPAERVDEDDALDQLRLACPRAHGGARPAIS